MRLFVCATLCLVGVCGASAQSFICENWIASYGNSEYFLDYINGNPDEYYRSMYSCPDIEQAIQNSERKGLLGWDGQCGHIMHIGGSKVYLRSDKATTPSLNIDMDGDGKPDFFGNMTTSDVPMNIDTSQRFKLEYNNQTYSVYDDSIIQ